jgi:pilus assembly protein CpaB
MNRRLITIVVALALAVAGTLAVLVYVRHADDRALAGKKATSILVAAKPVPAGTTVDILKSGGYLRVERYPVESVPADALSSLNDTDLASRVLGVNLKQGEMLTRPLLVDKGNAQAFSIPDGKIAVTVALNEPQRVAGYIKPGSKVVVFVTYKVIGSNDKLKGDPTRTKTLLRDIEVLSVSLAGSGNPSGGTAQSGSLDSKYMVTLAVKQNEAEWLVWGATGPQGGTQSTSLYLALQSDTSQLSDNSPGASSFTVDR